jgi:hypothetical protein
LGSLAVPASPKALQVIMSPVYAPYAYDVYGVVPSTYARSYIPDRRCAYRPDMQESEADVRHRFASAQLLSLTPEN